MKGSYRVWVQYNRGDEWKLVGVTTLAAEAKMLYRILTKRAWKVRLDLTIDHHAQLP